MRWKHLDTCKEVIYELPDDRSTAMVDDCVNKKLEDKNKNI